MSEKLNLTIKYVTKTNVAAIGIRPHTLVRYQSIAAAKAEIGGKISQAIAARAIITQSLPHEGGDGGDPFVAELGKRPGE